MERKENKPAKPKSGRYIAEKEPLEKIRIQVWFASVCEHAGIERPSIAELRKWLAKHDNSEGKLGDVEWERYEEGASSPRSDTLDTVEKCLPGTRTIYDDGPSGLPLWAVLNGDWEVCQEYVKVLIPKPDKTVSWLLKDKVQQLFDYLIAPAYRQDLATHMQARNRGFGPVWLSYVNGHFARIEKMIHRANQIKFGGKENEEENLDNLLGEGCLSELIVGAVALWQITLVQDEGFILEMEYLMTQLCLDIIAQEFNSIPLQDYVLSLLQEKARGIDKDFAKRDVDVPEFGKRSEITISLKGK